MDPVAMIPKPDDVMSMGDIITRIIVPIALAVWAGITYLWRRATAAQQKAASNALELVKTDLTSKIDIATRLLENSAGHLKEKQDHIQTDAKDMLAKIDGIRDKWDEFLKEYYQLDTTRANKLEAAFRRVDELKTSVGELRPAMMRKLEENLTTARNDLRDDMRTYVRDQIADLKRSIEHGK
jgi:hypothetical protein